MIDAEQQEKKSQTLQFPQLERDFQSQEKILQSQDTEEMWVSKDALQKYWWIKNQLIEVFTILGIIWWFSAGVNYFILNEIDKSPQQENIMKDTQNSVKHAFEIDTTAIIDDYKETLSSDELQEFEQFSFIQQREQAQGRKK